jgi:type IV pilus assembly protein PilQ
MSKNRRFSASELVRLAGRLPSVVAAATLMGVLCAPTTVWAQDKPGAPAQPAGQPKPTGDGKVVVSEHMTVDLHVKDEDLSNVLELLSIQSHKNIIASKSVGGKVTATLYNVTFYEALDSILHVNGFGYIEQGNFIYVYTLEELETIQKALNKRVAKTIRLNYLNAKDAQEFVKPLLSKDGGEIKVSEAAKAFKLPDDVPTGGEDYALGATIVVIDYEDNIKAIVALVKELDTRPAQVLVEATIIQTALNEANAFGVDFTILGDLNFTDFLNIGGPLSAANALVRGGNGTGTGGLSPLDNQGVAATSSVGHTEGPAGFKVGVISQDVSIFMKLLDEVTDTTILSNPKVLSLNRQPARVLVGRRVGYLSSTATDTSTTQTVQFLDTGTQLYFRPFISSEGEIRMELKPQVSEAIIRDSTSATGASVSIPDEVTQGVTTNVMVRDGQTIVLGGLFRENTQFTKRQVPVLGDIPVVGAAFRGHEDATTRSEIIFMIKPTIVTDTLLATAADRAGQDIERLRAGSRQGLLPWSREKMTAGLNVDAERFARDGDYGRAMWCLNRSLSLNALQPDAYRLREKITGEREVWPDRSSMEYFLDNQAAKRIEAIHQPQHPIHQKLPYGHRRLPKEKIEGKGAGSPGADATAPATGTQQAPAWQQATPSAFVSPEPAGSQPSAQVATPAPVDSIATAAGGDPGAAALMSVLENSTLAPEAVRRLLPSLRGRISAQIQSNSGVKPNLGSTENRGWGELVTNKVVPMPVTNFWVGGPNADVVIARSTPDKAFHRDYGWIYNPETGQLWAAGFDGNDQPLPRPNATALINPDNRTQASVPTGDTK